LGQYFDTLGARQFRQSDTTDLTFNIRKMSPLRKVRIIRKWNILDDIFIFRTSVMPEHQGVENNGNIAKRAVSRYYDFLEWTQK
jgi:hypothetical protein